MKKLFLLLWLCAIVAGGCATQQGCPANNFYTKSTKKANKKARKQMDSRVF